MLNGKVSIVKVARHVLKKNPTCIEKNTLRVKHMISGFDHILTGRCRVSLQNLIKGSSTIYTEKQCKGFTLKLILSVSL